MMATFISTQQSKIVQALVVGSIGVFEGVNTKSFRNAMDDEGIIIAVDPYPRSLFGFLGFGWIRRIAHNEVEQVNRGTILWIETLGQDAVNDIKVKNYLPVDFIFIDGDHSYDGIKGDWEAWSDFVAPCGVIALHDSINCQNPNTGSQLFTQEVIMQDERFLFVEAIDTLTILVKK